MFVRLKDQRILNTRSIMQVLPPGHNHVESADKKFTILIGWTYSSDYGRYCKLFVDQEDMDNIVKAIEADQGLM